MSKKASKFFRVAVEGVTTDGREITRDWIQQMAATYNRAKYGARVFAEHIRGVMPDGPFRALGDVIAVKAEEIDDGDLKGKLALFAQIAPSDVMVKLIASGQKIYSSIEVDPSFADSKLAYLVGLGITDSPASLGTEVLSFAAQHPDANPFATRKQRPDNLFSAGTETQVELEDEPAATASDDAAAGVFARLQELLEKFVGKAKPADTPAPTPAPTETENAQLVEFVQALSGGFDELIRASAQTRTSVDDLKAELAAHKQASDAVITKLQQQLDETPATGAARPAASGGNGAVLTDC